MPINPDRLLSWPFPEVEHTYTERDVMLYALDIGFNADPRDLRPMAFICEHGLREGRRDVVALDSGSATWKSERHVGAI